MIKLLVIGNLGKDAVVNNVNGKSVINFSVAHTEKYKDAQGNQKDRTVWVECAYWTDRTAIAPYLKKGTNAHILNLSPPINMDLKWFQKHLAYTISKYNMSMIALGLSAELKQYNIAANALWPKTTIATAAVNNLLGGEMLMKMSRTVDIIADAAYSILNKPSTQCTGNTFIDEDVLAAEGITDLSKYSVVPGATLYNDLFV